MSLETLDISRTSHEVENPQPKWNEFCTPMENPSSWDKTIQTPFISRPHKLQPANSPEPVTASCSTSDASLFMHPAIFQNMESDEAIDPKEQEIQSISDDRDRLLVRMFENKSSTEDDARLAILTEKLRSLVPIVSKASLDALENTTRKLEEMSESLSRLKKEFNLR